MALEGFFDGSGKAHDPNCRFVSLGGFAGTANGWESFSAKWQHALAQHEAPASAGGHRYFHRKEAMQARGGYVSWGSGRVLALVNDLFSVIAGQDSMDVVAISAAVQLDDYRKVKKMIPNLRTAENICVDWCLGHVLRHPARDTGISLAFDKAEPFYPIVDRVWKYKKGRRIWWQSLVRSIEQVSDMKACPQIQAADLLAWLVNRYHTVGVDDQWGSLLFRTFILKSHGHGFFNETALLAAFNSDGTMKPGVELPFSVKAPPETTLSVGLS